MTTRIREDTLTFGSKSIRIHILRGILGFCSLYGAVTNLEGRLWLAAILLPVAVFLLRGCPLCWTIGLLETIALSIHRRYEDAGRDQMFEDENGEYRGEPASDRKHTTVLSRSTYKKAVTCLAQ